MDAPLAQQSSHVPLVCPISSTLIPLFHSAFHVLKFTHPVRPAQPLTPVLLVQLDTSSHLILRERPAYFVDPSSGIALNARQ